MSRLGTNYIPLGVLLPLWLIVAFFVIRFIVRSKGSIRKTLALSLAGFLTLVGTLAVLVGMYAAVNQTFRGTLTIFALTHLPDNQDDPLVDNPVMNGSTVFAQFGVVEKNGQRAVVLLNDQSMPLALYAPGKWELGTINNGILTVDSNSAMRTSLGWLLTKDPSVLISPAE